jgi:hypothetical protein
MWKQIFELIRQTLKLVEETQKNKADIKEIQKELKDFSISVEHEFHELRRTIERLAYEIKRVDDQDASEREKLMLQLENQLLRFERRLSSGTKTDKSED